MARRCELLGSEVSMVVVRVEEVKLLSSLAFLEVDCENKRDEYFSNLTSSFKILKINFFNFLDV